MSTNRWLDEQADISRSLRVLIRESIQREGYIDVDNKPVEQLPRRGRPPQTEQGGQSGSSRDEATGAVAPKTGDTLNPGADEMDLAGLQRDPAIEPEASGADGSEKSPADAAASEQPAEEPGAEPRAPADEPAAPEPEPAEPPRKQASIDEIMASTRR
ncbi:hypothetical protein ACFOY4_01440 [Actinomadura syzygii]|uniref:Uncharacterized protein n=1 Tax=Actinomadura syzygii TaxID=1427538 RepID=A0A5D0TUR1_9ACTN|nr:hypothetical protein [Actinomadura syzygii]TYC08589.1 hypothetical protein FXF65_37485 [Actinomadura syzygii]